MYACPNHVLFPREFVDHLFRRLGHVDLTVRVSFLPFYTFYLYFFGEAASCSRRRGDGGETGVSGPAAVPPTMPPTSFLPPYDLPMTVVLFGGYGCYLLCCCCCCRLRVFSSSLSLMLLLMMMMPMGKLVPVSRPFLVCVPEKLAFKAFN